MRMKTLSALASLAVVAGPALSLAQVPALPLDFEAQIRQVSQQAQAAAKKAAAQRQAREPWWKPLEERQAALDQLRDAVEPSVLQIETGRSEGAGFIFDASGLVMTAGHVVAGVDEVSVLSDHVPRTKARVVARAPERDIAILQIEGGRRDWPALRFADAASLRRTNPVFSFGNPLGLGIAIHQGLIQRCENTSSNPYATCVQASTSLGPGDSGGPLVNIRGEVVGLNESIPAGTRDVSFAVRSDVLQRAVAEYRKEKTLSDYGLQLQLAYYPMRGGGLVLAVRKAPNGSPLREDDVLEAVDGENLPRDGSALNQLKQKLAKKGKNQTVRLTVLRIIVGQNGRPEEARETVELSLEKLAKRVDAARPPSGIFILPGGPGD